jgi:hypothetical protein
MPDASWDCFWLVRYEKSRRVGTFVFISPERRIRGYCGYGSLPDNENTTDLLAPQADCCSLRIRLYEGLRAGREPRIVLQLASKESYGGSIRTRVRRHGNSIDVEHLGLVHSWGDAHGTFSSGVSSMDSLDVAEGKYQLRLMCLDRSDHYTLTITEKVIVLSPEQVHCTEADQRPYWRHPRNSFALYCKAPTEKRWMCEELQRRVRTHPEFEEFSFPDSGVASYSRGIGSANEFFPASFFKYPSEAELLKLEHSLRGFTNEVGARWPFVEIWVMDWKGRGFGNRDYSR